MLKILPILPIFVLTYDADYGKIHKIFYINLIGERNKQQKKKEKEKKIFMKTGRSDILNSKGLELFEQLRELRTIIAKEENMPTYIIFADKTLQDMCVKTPLTKEEMLKVAGVGENKYAHYGERFLDAIREYTGGVHEKFYVDEE